MLFAKEDEPGPSQQVDALDAGSLEVEVEGGIADDCISISSTDIMKLDEAAYAFRLQNVAPHRTGRQGADGLPRRPSVAAADLEKQLFDADIDFVLKHIITLN